MTSVTDDLPLAADFASATYDDWRKLVDGVLKGAPFEKLAGKTYDNLRIEPIYSRAQNAAPIAGCARRRQARAPLARPARRVLEEHTGAASHGGAFFPPPQPPPDLENVAGGL